MVGSAVQEQGCEGDEGNTERRSVVGNINVVEIERTIDAEYTEEVIQSLNS